MDSDVNFYVHIDMETYEIHSVSATPINNTEHQPVEISKELGHAFMTGSDNVFSYVAVKLKNGAFEIHKKANIQQVLSRLDIDRRIEEIKFEQLPNANIFFDIRDGLVELHYNGEAIKRARAPLRFYFTRFDDLSFLKCAFSLDVNILNNITEQNDLKAWPNPIKIRVDDTHDLSIYGIKGQAVSVIRKRNVKARTKRV